MLDKSINIMKDDHVKNPPQGQVAERMSPHAIAKKIVGTKKPVSTRAKSASAARKLKERTAKARERSNKAAAQKRKAQERGAKARSAQEKKGKRAASRTRAATATERKDKAARAAQASSRARERSNKANERKAKAQRAVKRSPPPPPPFLVPDRTVRAKYKAGKWGPPLQAHSRRAKSQDERPPNPTFVKVCENKAPGEKNDGILHLQGYSGTSDCAKNGKGVVAKACKVQVRLGKKFGVSPMDWKDSKKRNACFKAIKVRILDNSRFRRCAAHWSLLHTAHRRQLVCGHHARGGDQIEAVLQPRARAFLQRSSVHSTH